VGGRQRPAQGICGVLSSGLTVPFGARRRRHRRQHARRPAPVLHQNSAVSCLGQPGCCLYAPSAHAAATSVVAMPQRHLWQGAVNSGSASAWSGGSSTSTSRWRGTTGYGSGW
jgi:hypothetical protein